MPPAFLQSQRPFFVLPFCRSAVLPLTTKPQHCNTATRFYAIPCFLLYSSNPGIRASIVIALFPLNQHSYSHARHSVPTRRAKAASPARAGLPSLITRIPRSKSLHPAAHSWVLQPTHMVSSIITFMVCSSKCMNLFLLYPSFLSVF